MDSKNKYELPEGKLLHGIYFIDSKLGGGAFGIVYKAYKKDTKEVVAIKQIIREFLNGNPKLQELYNSETFTLIKLFTETDVYSLGVMIYKLLYGKYPYRSDTGNLRQVIKDRIKSIEYDVPGVIISDAMKDLLKRMICHDRHARITWEQIYQHPILQMDSFGVSLLLPAGSILLMPDSNQEAINLYKKYKHLMVTDSDCENKELQPGFKVNSEFNMTADKESSNETSHRSEFEALKQIGKEQDEKKSILNCIQDASLKYNHYRQLYVSIFQILKHIIKIPKDFRNKIIQFVLSKKAYNMTTKMENALSRGQNFFNIKYFEEFKRDENYKNIVSQMLGNVNDFFMLFQSAKKDANQILSGLQKEEQKKNVLIDLLQKELMTDQLTENYESLIKVGLSYDYRQLYNKLETSKDFDDSTKRIMFQYYIFARDMINQEQKFQDTEFNFSGYFNTIYQYDLENSKNQFKEIVNDLGLANIKL
ncbi:hypothetical protein ABPG74_018163 [Tetrahymena malaccensis]